MQMLVFDFPGVTSQQYDQLCRSLNNGQPLTSLADFHRAGYLIVAHVAGPTPDGGGRWWTCGSPRRRLDGSGRG